MFPDGLRQPLCQGRSTQRGHDPWVGNHWSKASQMGGSKGVWNNKVEKEMEEIFYPSLHLIVANLIMKGLSVAPFPLLAPQMAVALIRKSTDVRPGLFLLPFSMGNCSLVKKKP